MSKRPYTVIAEQEWPQHVWITGAGPYATISFCQGDVEPGSPCISVMLHPDEDKAREALAFIDRLACGGGCTQDHALFDLSSGRAVRK